MRKGKTPNLTAEDYERLEAYIERLILLVHYGRRDLAEAVEGVPLSCDEIVELMKDAPDEDDWPAAERPLADRVIARGIDRANARRGR
jgi:hypothetical protein